MRFEKPLPARWFAAALLPLLAACGPTHTDEGALRALGEYQDGVITFYNADGSGNCSFAPSPEDLDVAAIYIGQYENSAVCGACVQIDGPKNSLTVRIVDSCPDCPDRGHLDLSQSAFAKLADPTEGSVQVRWRMVTCDVQGPIRYHIKDGSSQWWTAIQVLNHRLPITKFEYWKGSAWVEVQRASYNYFVEPNGMGTGPIKVRVTALDGQTLEDTLPGPNADTTYDGAAQFKAG